jgi:hypothetical protein
LAHDGVDVTSAVENAEDDREGFPSMVEEKVVSADQAMNPTVGDTTQLLIDRSTIRRRSMVAMAC